MAKVLLIMPKELSNTAYVLHMIYREPFFIGLTLDAGAEHCRFNLSYS